MRLYSLSRFSLCCSADVLQVFVTTKLFSLHSESASQNKEARLDRSCSEY